MALRTYRTGQRTATGTTDAVITPNINGKIKCIEIIVSASTVFSITALQSNDADSIIEYLLGSSSSGVTIASDNKVYPRVLEQKASDGSNLTTYTEIVIDNKINIAVASLSVGDTWEVNIIYEEDD